MRDGNASARTGSGRASLKVTTLRTKQRLYSTHERATFAAPSYLPFYEGRFLTRTLQLMAHAELSQKGVRPSCGILKKGKKLRVVASPAEQMMILRSNAIRG